MRPAQHHDEPTTRPEPGPQSGIGPAAALLRALASCDGPAGLEQVCLALALHPEGAGFARAWLLTWEGERRRLECRGVGLAEAAAASLSAVVETAARSRLQLESPASVFECGPQDLHGVVSRAWSAGSAVGPGEPGDGAPWRDAAWLGAFTLRRCGGPWALVVGEWLEAPDVPRGARLEAIAALTSGAAQSQDLADQARRRDQHVAALARVTRAVVTTQTLPEVLQLVGRLASEMTGADGSALWIARDDGLRLETTHGPAGRRERLGRALQLLAENVARGGEARVLEDAVAELLLSPDAAADLGGVALLPLRAYERVVGVLVAWGPARRHRSDPPGFRAADVGFLDALADAAAMALDQAARCSALARGERERRQLAARLERGERLAAAGERAERLAHAARNPLASIAAFARRAHRSLADDAAEREYLEIILRESERLERLLAEHEAGIQPPSATLRLESLNGVVQDALSAAGDGLVRRRVRLLKKLPPELPALLLDRERIRRVVTNLLESAVEAAGVGGRVRIESRRTGGYAILEVAHDGQRSPGELLEDLFVPFASQRAGRSGVGLAVAQQIVREHGGEIRVRSEGEWGAIFSLSLPVAQNQDRRRSGPDRRRSRADRRERHGAGA